MHELRQIVADAEPVVLFYSDDWREQVDELRPSFDTIRDVDRLRRAGAGDRSFSERDGVSTS